MQKDLVPQKEIADFCRRWKIVEEAPGYFGFGQGDPCREIKPPLIAALEEIVSFKG